MPRARLVMVWQFGNADMQDPEDVRRTVLEMAQSFSNPAWNAQPGENGYLWDVNGNKVGGWEYAAEEKSPDAHVPDCATCGGLGDIEPWGAHEYRQSYFLAQQLGLPQL